MKLNISIKTLVLLQGVLVIGSLSGEIFLELERNISFLFTLFSGLQLGWKFLQIKNKGTGTTNSKQSPWKTKLLNLSTNHTTQYHSTTIVKRLST